MASFVLTRPDVFVSGTVAAYVKPALGVPASGAPSGSAVSSPSVSGNSVTFTGLADNTQYIAYQGSPDRYVSFRTAPASAAGETDPVAGPDLATHAALTTTAHGGVVASGDSRLSDSRAPNGAAGGVLGGTYPNPTFAADMATQVELDAVAASIPLVVANTRTADYTLVLTDAGKSVEENLGTATVVTIPPNSSVAFPTGTVIEICRIGAGSVTITPGAGVTIPNRVQAAGTTSRTIANQWSSATIRKRATDVWVLVGDIA